MKRNQKWMGLGGIAIAAALVLGLSVEGANADTTPTTLAQAQAAHDQIESANAVIQSYLDSQNDALKPSQASATPGDTIVTLRWQAPTQGTPTGYVYGRDGSDSTGTGAYVSDTLPTTATSAVLDKLINGTAYHVYVEAVYASGNKRVSFTATPAAEATPTPSATTPAPTDTATPTASATPSASPTASASPTTPTNSRVSGLAWSSGVWADGDPADEASFIAGPRGGKNVDNVLVYTTRDTIAKENNASEWRNELPSNFNGATQDLILGLTTWTTDGAYMTASQASAIGTSICSVDSVHPIVRLDWEMNLPDGAGQNGAMLNASNYSAWVSRFNAVAGALKASSCGIQIDFNTNVGVDQTTGCNSGSYAAPNNCSRQAFQAVKSNVDIYGIDTYDAYPPVTSSGSGWSARTNGSSQGSLENSRLYALANNKKFSVPEWGVACNVANCQWQGNAGGDDPTYVTDMEGYFSSHATDMAYETYFNERNAYILSDLISNNPNSRNAMKTFILAHQS